MILTLCLPLGVAAEDDPETAYDVSETLPYEGTALFSIEAPLIADRGAQEVLSPLHLRPGTSSMLTARVHDTGANRSTDARASLTLLCTLLC